MPLQKNFEFKINFYFLKFFNIKINSNHFYQNSLQNLNFQIEKKSLFYNQKFLLYFFTQNKNFHKKYFFSYYELFS